MISKISFHFTSHFLCYAILWKYEVSKSESSWKCYLELRRGHDWFVCVPWWDWIGSRSEQRMDRHIVSGAELYWNVFPGSQWDIWQHLLHNKLPSHSAVLRLKGFNSDGDEINELSHLEESVWVRKLQEDEVNREGDGHMRKDLWKTTSGPGPEEH